MYVTYHFLYIENNWRAQNIIIRNKHSTYKCPSGTAIPFVNNPKTHPILENLPLFTHVSNPLGNSPHTQRIPLL